MSDNVPPEWTIPGSDSGPTSPISLRTRPQISLYGLSESDSPSPISPRTSPAAEDAPTATQARTRRASAARTRAVRTGRIEKPKPQRPKASGLRWTSEMNDELWIGRIEHNTPYAVFADKWGRSPLACRLHFLALKKKWAPETVPGATTQNQVSSSGAQNPQRTGSLPTILPAPRRSDSLDHLGGIATQQPQARHHSMSNFRPIAPAYARADGDEYMRSLGSSRDSWTIPGFRSSRASNPDLPSFVEGALANATEIYWDTIARRMDVSVEEARQLIQGQMGVDVFSTASGSAQPGPSNWHQQQSQQLSEQFDAMTFRPTSSETHSFETSASPERPQRERPGRVPRHFDRQRPGHDRRARSPPTVSRPIQRSNVPTSRGGSTALTASILMESTFTLHQRRTTRSPPLMAGSPRSGSALPYGRAAEQANGDLEPSYGPIPMDCRRQRPAPALHGPTPMAAGLRGANARASQDSLASPTMPRQAATANERRNSTVQNAPATEQEKADDDGRRDSSIRHRMSIYDVLNTSS